MDDNTRYQNAKRLALALEEHSEEWGIVQQLALRLHYDNPNQIRQAIHDLAGCFDFNENGDNEDLINCPFCGGYAEYERRQPEEGYYPVPEIRAACMNCGIATMWVPEKDKSQIYPEKFSPIFPESYTPTDGKADVTRMWNRRILIQK
jgi:hypothetical protein